MSCRVRVEVDPAGECSHGFTPRSHVARPDSWVPRRCHDLLSHGALVAALGVPGPWPAACATDALTLSVQLLECHGEITVAHEIFTDSPGLAHEDEKTAIAICDKGDGAHIPPPHAEPDERTLIIVSSVPHEGSRDSTQTTDEWRTQGDGP